eukprot:4345156-Pyramimonas_sp.AAC.2
MSAVRWSQVRGLLRSGVAETSWDLTWMSIVSVFGLCFAVRGSYVPFRWIYQLVAVSPHRTFVRNRAWAITTGKGCFAAGECRH